MKKKISLLLCILLAVCCFTGCSNKGNNTEYDKETLEAYSETIINGFSNFQETDFQYFEEASEFWLNYYLSVEIQLPISAEDFVGMMGSWQAAEEECGKYVSHGDFVIEQKSDGFVVTASAKYENRNADISFTFDEKYNMESMDVSAKYSMGEILSKAGMNTLLGMGTVFAVLILLAFLISLMKYIPVVMEWFEKKGKSSEATVSQENVDAVTEIADEMDDLELVAVITAAIAATEETSTDGFVVRSIKRRPSNNWM